MLTLAHTETGTPSPVSKLPPRCPARMSLVSFPASAAHRERDVSHTREFDPADIGGGGYLIASEVGAEFEFRHVTSARQSGSPQAVVAVPLVARVDGIRTARRCSRKSFVVLPNPRVYILAYGRSSDTTAAHRSASPRGREVRFVSRPYAREGERIRTGLPPRGNNARVTSWKDGRRRARERRGQFLRRSVFPSPFYSLPLPSSLL